jgi:hypothetical protein
VSVAEVEPTAPPVDPAAPPEPEPVPEPEPEPQPEPEPVSEPEPEPPAPAVAPEALEKFYKALETRTKTFDNWLEAEAEKLGLVLNACPLCEDGIMGHIFPPEWISPTSELQARLVDVLKTPNAPEYRDAPNVRQCGTCGGWGSVLSGSHVAGKERVLCPTCRGNGFQGDAAQPVATNGATAEVSFELPPDTTPLVTEDTDIWGSPKVLDDGQDNPNYGKMPQYKNPALP